VLEVLHASSLSLPQDAAEPQSRPAEFRSAIHRHPGRTGAAAATLHLKGVGWTETTNIYTVVYDNSYVGYACALNSQGDVAIPLQATGDPGWHFIDLYPAIYRGEEQQPRNFLIPQLTYAADHPGEDLPQFRFAYEVTEDSVAGGGSDGPMRPAS
jgi:hypothetical protein